MSTYNRRPYYHRRYYSRDTYQRSGNRYPRVDYSSNYNAAKGTYFKGGYDADGNYYDID